MRNYSSQEVMHDPVFVQELFFACHKIVWPLFELSLTESSHYAECLSSGIGKQEETSLHCDKSAGNPAAVSQNTTLSTFLLFVHPLYGGSLFDEISL